MEYRIITRQSGSLLAKLQLGVPSSLHDPLDFLLSHSRFPFFTFVILYSSSFIQLFHVLEVTHKYQTTHITHISHIHPQLTCVSCCCCFCCYNECQNNSIENRKERESRNVDHSILDHREMAPVGMCRIYYAIRASTNSLSKGRYFIP